MKIACDIFPRENYSVQDTSFSYCPKDLVTDKVNQPKVISWFIAPYVSIREKLELTVIQKVSDNQSFIY